MHKVRTGSWFCLCLCLAFAPIRAIRLEEARRTRHPLVVPGPRDHSTTRRLGGRRLTRTDATDSRWGSRCRGLQSKHLAPTSANPTIPDWMSQIMDGTAEAGKGQKRPRVKRACGWPAPTIYITTGLAQDGRGGRWLWEEQCGPIMDGIGFMQRIGGAASSTRPS